MTTESPSSEHQWAVAYAELGAKHAMTVAGGKLVGRLGRAERHHTKPHRQQVAPWDRHTVAPAEGADLDRILADAYNVLPPDIDCLLGAIDSYVRDRLANQQPHDPIVLYRTVTEHGCHQHA